MERARGAATPPSLRFPDTSQRTGGWVRRIRREAAEEAMTVQQFEVARPALLGLHAALLLAERREREREALSRGSGLAGIKPADAVKPKARAGSEPRRPTAKRRPPAAAETSHATARGSLQRLD